MQNRITPFPIIPSVIPLPFKFTQSVRFDYIKKKASPIKIIAQRKDFPEGESKREGLEDILFSGGLRILNDEYVELFVGLSDCQVGRAIISNPFSRF